MTSLLAGLADEIEHGKGLAMIRNMPTQDSRLSEDDLAVMYLGISAHIGRAPHHRAIFTIMRHACVID